MCRFCCSCPCRAGSDWCFCLLPGVPDLLLPLRPGEGRSDLPQKWHQVLHRGHLWLLWLHVRQPGGARVCGVSLALREESGHPPNTPTLGGCTEACGTSTSMLAKPQAAPGMCRTEQPMKPQAAACSWQLRVLGSYPCWPWFHFWEVTVKA